MGEQPLLISKELINVFLRDINKRKSEGKPSLEKYAEELGEQIAKQEPALAYVLIEILKILPMKDEQSFLSGFGFCYDLFRRKIEREYLENSISERN